MIWLKKCHGTDGTTFNSIMFLSRRTWLNSLKINNLTMPDTEKGYWVHKGVSYISVTRSMSRDIRWSWFRDVLNRNNRKNEQIIKWVNGESAVLSSHWLFVTEFQAASVECDSLLDSITVRSTEIKQEN